MNADELCIAGNEALDRGEYKTALNLYEQAAGMGSGRGMYNAGVVYWEQGDVAAAASWFERSSNADFTDAYHALGTVLDSVGQTHQARLAYEAGWRLGDSNCANALGLQLLQAGDATAARSLFEKSAALGDESATINLATFFDANGERQANDFTDPAVLKVLATAIPEELSRNGLAEVFFACAGEATEFGELQLWATDGDNGELVEIDVAVDETGVLEPGRLKRDEFALFREYDHYLLFSYLDENQAVDVAFALPHTFRQRSARDALLQSVQISGSTASLPSSVVSFLTEWLRASSD